jgi:toxin secretion/phage lysis holin
MTDKMLGIKAAIAAFFSALATVLGWQGIMILVWVTVMIIDYITGTAAASKKGEWSSAVARQGVWHKCGMIVVVLVAIITDLGLSVICAHLPIGITWTSIILPLVLAWYIVTELGSILENAVKMGAKVPGWLIKILKISAQAINNEGEKIEAEVETVLEIEDDDPPDETQNE